MCDISMKFLSLSRRCSSSQNVTSGEDGDGRENVTEKVNLHSFNLHRNYSKSLILSDVGKPSQS